MSFSFQLNFNNNFEGRPYIWPRWCCLIVFISTLVGRLVRFLTKWTTLQQPNCSRLSQLSTSDPSYDPDYNEFYFDRSWTLFECIIDMHRTGALHLPHNVCVPKVLDEMRFWDVALQNVACCCWTRIREHTNDSARIKELKNIQDNATTSSEGKAKAPYTDTAYLTNRKSHGEGPPNAKQKESCLRKVANSVFTVLDKPRSSHLAMVSNIDVLMRKRRNFIANALELRLSCISSSICWFNSGVFFIDNEMRSCCHDKGTLSALPALCDGNPDFTGGFHLQRTSDVALCRVAVIGHAMTLI